MILNQLVFTGTKFNLPYRNKEKPTKTFIVVSTSKNNFSSVFFVANSVLDRVSVTEGGSLEIVGITTLSEGLCFIFLKQFEDPPLLPRQTPPLPRFYSGNDP